MKCRVCTNQLTKKNKSPLKGVCKSDFRSLTPGTLYRLNTPPLFGHIVHDISPTLTSEQHAKYIASLKASPFYEYEVELDEGQLKLLKEIRRKRITSINTPLSFNEASLIPPVQLKKKKIVEVKLDEIELRLLEELRARRLFGVESVGDKKENWSR